MSVIEKNVALILISVNFCVTANATVNDSPANPYQGIVDRNVFGLKPPQAAPQKIDKPVIEAPKITLTGITTILGNKRVLMNVAMPAKPPEPSKMQSYILTEGQREGGLEIIEINEKTGTVKVDDFGTLLTLNLDKDGAKLPPSSALPVATQQNPAGIAPPTATTSFHPSGMNTAVPVAQRNSLPGYVPQQGSVGSSGTISGLGGAQFTGSPQFAGSPQVAPGHQQSSYEEQVIMMEAQHQIALGAGDSIMAKIIPPTELNPTRNTIAPLDGEASTPNAPNAPVTQNPSTPRPPFGNPFPHFPQ